MSKTGEKVLSLMVAGALLGGGFGLGCATTPAGPEEEVHQEAPSGERTFEDSDLVPIGDSPVKGNPDAPIVIVEFMSLQCGFCARGAETMRALQDVYPDDVQVVFKHLPLQFQQESFGAAMMTEAAREQGNFWEMRDAILRRMGELNTRGALELGWEIAEELGLDMEAFEASLADPALEDRIREDVALAQRLGIRGTPVFIINGISVSGAQPLENFQLIVNYARQMRAELEERGVPEGQLYAQAVRDAVEAAALEQEAQRQEQGAQLQPGASVNFEVQEDDLVYGETEEFQVTIVEFSSLQCPFCARGAQTMEALKERYEGQVRFVFQHFPLGGQAQSFPAARAVVAAQEQGKGEEMVQLIFSEQRRLGEEGVLREWAERLELDLAEFDAVREAEETQARVQGNLERAQALGVRGTPTFLVNGVVVVGAQPPEHFMEIIEAELRRVEEIAAETGLSGEALYLAAMAAERPDPLAAPEDVATPPEDAEVTESGLASRVLEPGEGDAAPGPTSEVLVHYTGWTAEGELFDSSVVRGEPAVFPLDRVIDGFAEGLQLMVEGEKRRFWIPEELAYGPTGPLPGMLVFDVQLIEILR